MQLVTSILKNFVRTMSEKRLKSRYIYLPLKTTETLLRVLEVYILGSGGGENKAGRETAVPTPSFAKLSFSSDLYGRLPGCSISSSTYFVPWFLFSICPSQIPLYTHKEITIKYLFKSSFKTHFPKRLSNCYLLVNYIQKIAYSHLQRTKPLTSTKGQHSCNYIARIW